MSNWEETLPKLRRVVALRRHEQTLDEVAASIPLGRSTLYRMLSEEVDSPALAVRECVERFVEKGERFLAKASQLARTPSAPPPDAAED